MKKFFRRFLRVIFGTILFLLLGLGILAYWLSLPSTHTYLANKGIEWLESKFDVSVQIETAQVRLPNLLQLKSLLISDEYRDTLFYAPNFEVRVGRSTKTNIVLRKVNIEEPYIRMMLPEGDTVNNWQVFIQKFIPKTDPDTNIIFSIDKVEMSGVHFKKYLSPEERQFNFWNSHIELSGFVYHNGRVDANLDSIAFTGKRLQLNHLGGKFKYKKDKGVYLSDMHLQTEKSEIFANLGLEVDSNADYNDFVNRVRLQAEFEDVKASSQEFMRFFDKFPNLDDFVLSGKIWGKINDLEGRDVRFRYGANTSGVADLTLQNIAEEDMLFANFGLKYFRSNYEEFHRLMKALTGEDISFTKPYLPTFTFAGEFVGDLESFRSVGTLHTEDATLDLELDFDAVNKPLINASYKGQVKGRGVNLRKISGIDDFGTADFNARIDGKGLTLDLFSAKIKGEVKRVAYQNYNYKNISLDGQFEALFFDGQLKIKDPNLDLQFDGTADFTKENFRLDFIALINNADIFGLGFYADDSIYLVNGEAFVNLARNVDGEWVGEARLSDCLIQRSRGVYFFRDITASSYEKGSQNVLSVQADFIEFLAT
ncbi:MAG: hypothetical protein JJU02_03010 [Cryomorphaceae bacterium]|nr:hypothetical protein [Cryomorphaceae bacterium]